LKKDAKSAKVKKLREIKRRSNKKLIKVALIKSNTPFQEKVTVFQMSNLVMSS